MDVSEQHIMFYSLIYLLLVSPSTLFYSLIFYPILFYTIPLYSILFYSILYILLILILFPSILFPSILFPSILFYSLVFPSFHKKISGRRIPGIKAGAGDDSREMKKRTDSREGLGAGAVGM